MMNPTSQLKGKNYRSPTCRMTSVRSNFGVGSVREWLIRYSQLSKSLQTTKVSAESELGLYVRIFVERQESACI